MDKTKKTKLKYNKDWSWGYFMVAPTMIGLFILNIFPIFQTIYMSFTKSGSFGKVSFVGLDNYKAIVQDKLVLQSFINTFNYDLAIAGNLLRKAFEGIVNEFEQLLEIGKVERLQKVLEALENDDSYFYDTPHEV